MTDFKPLCEKKQAILTNLNQKKDTRLALSPHFDFSALSRPSFFSFSGQKQPSLAAFSGQNQAYKVQSPLIEPVNQQNARLFSLSSPQSIKSQAAPFGIEPKEDYSVESISAKLCSLLKDEPRELVFVCIGSDLVTGDSLGPLVGQFLTAKYSLPAFVYGTLRRTVTALNVESTRTFLLERHSRARVVAVDAALGEASDVGAIKVTNEGIVPSAAFDRGLNRVGEAGIIAVVGDINSGGLLTTRLSLVWRLAETIAKAICLLLKERGEFSTLNTKLLKG